MKRRDKNHPSMEPEETGLSPDTVSALRRMVQSERSASMMSMPTERVMRAVKAAYSSKRRQAFLERELVSWFRPVVGAGLVVILALAFYNFDQSRENDHHQTPTEMVLGLHPVTVAAAYDLEFDHHED